MPHEQVLSAVTIPVNASRGSAEPLAAEVRTQLVRRLLAKLLPVPAEHLWGHLIGSVDVSQVIDMPVRDEQL